MDADNLPELENLLAFLKQNRGFDFTGYKRSSLVRRIQKRMLEVKIQTYSEYQDFLEVHPEEFERLFNTILINVTGFFRDPPTWDYLAKGIIPQILFNRAMNEPIRVWSAGCASGEEAYSVAMLLAEALGLEQYRERVKIYATDVDEEALNKARQGIYAQKEVEEVPSELLSKYFEGGDGTCTFRKEYRRNLIFGRNDLTQDAPISRVDLLICRNTLMYFNAETQSKILARFHFALRENGFLFLGKAETLLTQAQVFNHQNMKLHVYSKAGKINLRDRMLLMAQTGELNGVNTLLSMAHLRELVLETSPLAQIIVDAKQALVFANGQARLLLHLRNEDVGRSFQDLEFSYRPGELRSILERSLKEGLPAKIIPVSWKAGDEEQRHFEVQIQPLFDNGLGLLGAGISFSEISKHIFMEKRLEMTNQELATSLEELQATMEEMETTQEELQSSMEESETTNEELQSANEELETMNEEMQSINEELQAVNDELHRRTGELNQLNALTGSILASLRMGVIVLDRDLRILVWNYEAEDLWGLRSDEVVGKHLLNLDIGLPVAALRESLKACLSGKEDYQEITLPARNRRGRDFQCKVVCSPLLDLQKTIDGVIVLQTEVVQV